MNVLEKILEEIEYELKLVHEEKENCSKSYYERARGYEIAMESVLEIIRSHMDDISDDSWILCSERLPSNEEFRKEYCRNAYAAEFLVTIEGTTRATTLYFRNGDWFDESRNYYKVIAWKPLPEAHVSKKEAEK